MWRRTNFCGSSARERTSAMAQVAIRALSLSLSCITRVAPHCVNTLMILHAAHTQCNARCLTPMRQSLSLSGWASQERVIANQHRTPSPESKTEAKRRHTHLNDGHIPDIYRTGPPHILYEWKCYTPFKGKEALSRAKGPLQGQRALWATGLDARRRRGVHDWSPCKHTGVPVS